MPPSSRPSPSPSPSPSTPSSTRVDPVALAALREEYGDHGIDPATLPECPLVAFDVWLGEALAAGLPEPNAMTLATLGEAGPEARIVLLKARDERGFVFYTSYESGKARELARDPACALVFDWLGAMRQVRVRGRAERVSREESGEYFRTRPRQSQLGAWASRQSAVLASRDELEAKMAEVTARFEGGPVPLPDGWGGFRVVPTQVELWQGRASRLHDRVRYTRGPDGAWTRVRLSP
ncbi:MAG: pyridoxamine 5'-phosphate oxidase [Myxococcales bacterium]|nr:pyridoxamine 5'-phosphate oxidase [Myxococcales bacterium]